MRTSDERREVAENLREQLMYMRKDNSYDEDVNVVDCGNSAYRNIAWSVESYGNFEKGNYVHIIERLADLIDPTCEMVVKYGHACCGRCGHVLAGEREVEEGYYEFRPFCPDCGARVVRDDD